LDLTVLADLKPGGVLVEIMNNDGSMARLPELMKMARELGSKNHHHQGFDRLHV
jgi:3,4-dihydroxy 2-butanone 4-phosphate synthase/GTP cyclohydrolase II